MQPPSSVPPSQTPFDNVPLTHVIGFATTSHGAPEHLPWQAAFSSTDSLHLAGWKSTLVMPPAFTLAARRVVAAIAHHAFTFSIGSVFASAAARCSLGVSSAIAIFVHD